MYLNLTLNNQDSDEDILINFDHVKSVGIEDDITAIYMMDGETVYYVEETLEQIAEWLSS